jgi:hypothetical protein
MGQKELAQKWNDWTMKFTDAGLAFSAETGELFIIQEQIDNADGTVNHIGSKLDGWFRARVNPSDPTDLQLLKFCEEEIKE